MIFSEWAEKYGIESARNQFGLSDHLVMIVHPDKYVRGRCGNWLVNEPLGLGQTVESALDRIRGSIADCFETEEIL